MTGVSPSEARMARIRDARAWLEGRGYRTKAVLDATPPVPRYQITSVRGLVTADGLLSVATNLGWAG
jgi:hypothetical protein